MRKLINVCCTKSGYHTSESGYGVIQPNEFLKYDSEYIKNLLNNIQVSNEIHKIQFMNLHFNDLESYPNYFNFYHRKLENIEIFFKDNYQFISEDLNILSINLSSHIEFFKKYCGYVKKIKILNIFCGYEEEIDILFQNIFNNVY